MRWLLILLLFFPLKRFCEKKTAGFSMMQISEATVGDGEKISTVKDFLQQKFFFLDRGGQCFVFVSEDEKLVLKLMKRRFSPRIFLDFPLPSFLKEAVHKKENYNLKKTRRDEKSYALAYAKMKEETGLLFLHLQKTEKDSCPVVIVDKLGIQHLVDMNNYAFILQKRAVPLMQALKHAGRTHAKEILDETLVFLKRQNALGIHDEDPRLHKNLGVLEGKVIAMDVGRFSERSVPFQEKTTKLQAWLSEENPLLAQYLKERTK